MIDISKGRYWDLPWSLVDGCTPCSPGCDHCWSAGIAHRFRENIEGYTMITSKGKFNGVIVTHCVRFTIPLKRRKPTVYAVWNDLFHEAVPDDFRNAAYAVMTGCERHTYLVLTKRPLEMLRFVSKMRIEEIYHPRSIWHGLTVCNQQEADAKIPVFLQVPGKKFLSIEPMLGPVSLGYTFNKAYIESGGKPILDAVILGGETGPGARPMKIEWIRSIRDQCQSAGVPFFFKSWGKYPPFGNYRLLDGWTHNKLPWRKI